MALFGEGNPRWIVEERPDATNVNNWHWTEKNASQWSKNKIDELLLNLEIDEPGLGKCKIIKISSMDGEAFANNRKAKLIFFYEWNITCKWEGFLYGSDTKVKGNIEIPNLSEENDLDEIEIGCTLSDDEGSIEGDAMKGLMRNKGKDIIREKLAHYIKELKEDFAKDLILPTKDSAGKIQPTLKHSGKSQITSNNKSNGINYFEEKQDSELGEIKDLDIVQEMKCTAEDFYNALTILELAQTFTHGPVTLDPKEGGYFAMFGDNISGFFVSLEPYKVIRQKWRYRSWPEGHFSDVLISIDQREDMTVIKLKQTGIPAFDYDRTEQGWKTHYFESIKRTFGFGSILY